MQIFCLSSSLESKEWITNFVVKAFTMPKNAWLNQTRQYQRLCYVLVSDKEELTLVKEIVEVNKVNFLFSIGESNYFQDH